MNATDIDKLKTLNSRIDNCIRKLDYQPKGDKETHITIRQFGEILSQSKDDTIFVMLRYSTTRNQFIPCAFEPMSSRISFDEKDGCAYLYSTYYSKRRGDFANSHVFPPEQLLAKGNPNCQTIMHADTEIVRPASIDFFGNTRPEVSFSIDLPIRIDSDVDYGRKYFINDTIFFDVCNNKGEKICHCVGLITYFLI